MNSKLTETGQPGTLVIIYVAKIISIFMGSGNNNFFSWKMSWKSHGILFWKNCMNPVRRI